MRTIELAVYADALAAEAAALAARLERTRSALRQSAIEREAVAALPPPVVGRLRALGLLTATGAADGAAEVERIDLDLRALLQLQAWVERRLQAESAGPLPALRDASQAVA
jgi:hypothetical protein